VRDGVLIDLRRLNRIRELNTELAYVTLEAGVTQRQLHEFVRTHAPTLWMDATGASPDCSIVGNTMERGFGHTPMGDHASTACGFEVVLPNGELITTGFGQFESAEATPLSRAGVGPALDGLFLQSNLGIVTSMTVWLMPAPEHFEAFFFLCDDERGLGPIIDALRPLKLNGTLRSVMHIGNDYKVLAGSGPFPWGEAEGGVLDAAGMAALRRKFGIAAWSGAGGLYGTRAQVREARRLVKRALAGKVNQLRFMDDRRFSILWKFAKPLSAVVRRDLVRLLTLMRPVYNLLKGIPTDSTISSAYWRKREAAPKDGQCDPDRDGCGLLWCAPVVPMTGAALSEVTALASEVVLKGGFEPQMSVSLATERMAICVITITYDRSETGADEAAMRCYRSLAEQLSQRGYPLYRRNVAAMQTASESPAYAALLRDLKSALDPNAILAPGRYEPVPAVVHPSAVKRGA
jgi:4-cresol dehydrogenase (hydroxylating)